MFLFNSSVWFCLDKIPMSVDIYEKDEMIISQSKKKLFKKNGKEREKD